VALAQWVLAMVWRADDGKVRHDATHGYGTHRLLSHHHHDPGDEMPPVSRQLQAARLAVLHNEALGFSSVFTRFESHGARVAHRASSTPPWAVALAFAVCSFYNVQPTLRNAHSIVSHVAFCHAAVDLDPGVMHVRVASHRVHVPQCHRSFTTLLSRTPVTFAARASRSRGCRS